MTSSFKKPIQPFILASASPRRKSLLTEAGYRFETISTGVEEPDPVGFPSVESFVMHAAHLKALGAARPPGADDRWILAADTVAELDGVVLGKPRDRAHAHEILAALQGTKHRTWTGVCLLLPRSNVALLAAEATVVQMRSLTEPKLDFYLDSGAWQGKAGAYGIQDHDDPFVERIDGSFTNVVGLPMERVNKLFAQAAVIESGEK
jgi:septum formation protein